MGCSQGVIGNQVLAHSQRSKHQVLDRKFKHDSTPFFFRLVVTFNSEQLLTEQNQSTIGIASCEQPVGGSGVGSHWATGCPTTHGIILLMVHYLPIWTMINHSCYSRPTASPTAGCCHCLSHCHCLEEQMGALFEHELQLRSSSPQRIVIDYSSPNIAKEHGERHRVPGFLHRKNRGQQRSIVGPGNHG